MDLPGTPSVPDEVFYSFRTRERAVVVDDYTTDPMQAAVVTLSWGFSSDGSSSRDNWQRPAGSVLPPRPQPG